MTAAAVLRGVPIQAADIDLLMRECADVDRFSSALAAFACVSPPTFLADAKQYYAAYDVQGAQVEASILEWPTDSGCIETLGGGPWKHFTLIHCDPYQVPTIALELRLVSELLRDPSDRCRPLIAWMHASSITVLKQRLSAGPDDAIVTLLQPATQDVISDWMIIQPAVDTGCHPLDA